MDIATILVIGMAVIVFGGGVFAWWSDHGKTDASDEHTSDKDNQPKAQIISDTIVIKKEWTTSTSTPCISIILLILLF